MTQKYHISPKTGRPNKCYATIKPCPIGGDSEHYSSKEEARAAYEAMQVSSGNSFAKISRNPKNSRLVSLVKALPANPSIDDLKSVGKVFNNAVLSRLSFDPNSVLTAELSKDQLIEIRDATIEVMSEVTTFNDSFGSNWGGPLAKNLDYVTGYMPDGAKKLLTRKVQVVKTRKGAFRSGQYAFNGMKSLVQKKVSIKNFEIREGRKLGVEEFSQTYYTLANKYSSIDELKRLEEDTGAQVSSGELAYKLSDDGEYVESYWIGLKPSISNGNTYRKVKGNFKVRGRSETILQEVTRSDVNLWKVYKKSVGGGDRMEIPEYPECDESKSTIIHELSHSIQFNVNRVCDHEAFKHFSVSLQKSFSSDYKTVLYDGFPAPYMGESSGMELFPVSSEGLLAPQAFNNSFFYGSDRHSRADEVKDWVMGYWLQLDKLGRESGVKG